MAKDIQQMDFVKTTVLTASGGATPAVTGPAQKFTEVESDFSAVLVNAGLSTDLTVTYQMGYLGDGVSEDAALHDETLITWLTPQSGGTIARMTNANIPGDDIHADLSLSVGKYYRFTITNNDAVRAATVRLVGICQF